jgi:hypothetical protein
MAAPEQTIRDLEASSDSTIYIRPGTTNDKAWLVAIGASCTIFSTLGFSNSFGVLQEYYAVHQLQNESSDRIAWIGSLAAFLQFATGAVAGPLFDRYGAWVRFPRQRQHICPCLTTAGNPTSSHRLRVRPDDDKPLHQILAIHARPGGPCGYIQWHATIPRHGCGLAVL